MKGKKANVHHDAIGALPKGKAPFSADSSAVEIHQLFQVMPWGVSLVEEANGKILAVNASLASLAGIGSTSVLPTNLGQIIPQLTLSGESKGRLSFSEDEQEAELVRPDETKVPVEIISRKVTIGGRNRVAVFVRDITRRKQTTEALFVSRFFMDKSSGLIFWVDNSGKIVYANEGAAQQLGYSINELLNMTIHDVDVNFPPSLWPMMWEHFKKVQNNVLESVFKANNGRKFPVEISGSYVKYQEKEYNFVFAWDVSRRKKAEDALKESQQRLSAFISSASDSFLLYDSELKLVEINPAALDFLHVTSEQVLGKHLFELGGRLGFAEHADKYQDVLTHGGSVSYSTSNMNDKYGEQYLEVKIFKVGEGLGIIATDVTERKMMEQELLLHQTQLEKLVEERTADLAKVNAELTEQIEQRKMFTHALVHDLKTPLTPLLGSSEALVNGLTEEPWQRMARSVRMGAEKLNQTVSQLFDLEKGQIGLLELNCSNIDAVRLLRDMADYALPEAEANQQEFVVALPDDLGRVWADSSRLGQVLLNLLNNAFKFTKRNGRIELSAKTEEGYLVIKVKDNGIGIPEGEQEDIFLPYRRLSRKDMRHGGLGLGLALSRQLIELHGGTIEVNSGVNSGSTFIVKVPIKRQGN